MSNQAPTAEQRRHWSVLAGLGCLLCGRPAQIAHVHGPSLRERDPRLLKPKGRKQRWMHWLTAPLCPDHHFQLDHAPTRLPCSPAALLDMVAAITGVDVWRKAIALLAPPVGMFHGKPEGKQKSSPRVIESV